MPDALLVVLRGRERKPRVVEGGDLFEGQRRERERLAAREWWVVLTAEESLAVRAASSWPSLVPGAKVLDHGKRR